MSVKELAEFRADVGAILNGRFVVSDRVFDRVEEIAPLALAYEPQHWEVDLETQPERARAMVDAIDELQYVISVVKDQYADELGHQAEVQAVAGQEGGSET